MTMTWSLRNFSQFLLLFEPPDMPPITDLADKPGHKHEYRRDMAEPNNSFLPPFHPVRNEPIRDEHSHLRERTHQCKKKQRLLLLLLVRRLLLAPLAPLLQFDFALNFALVL